MRCMAFFSELKLDYFRKMYGYPLLRFPLTALVKEAPSLRNPGFSDHPGQFVHNLPAVTKVDTQSNGVLN